MKKTTALLLAVAVGLAVLAGCGAKLSGRYELVSMSSGGEEVALVERIQMRKEFLGNDQNGGNFDSYIEFIDETNCKVVFFGDSREGTYTLDDKTIEIVAAGGEPQTMILEGKKIILDIGEEQMIFEKK